MIELKHIELHTDPAAQRVIKEETVMVEFAAHEGVLNSLEGMNHYQVGDALLTSAAGERWVVSRARFDAKYQPTADWLAPGQPGAYQNRPVVILAKQMHTAFTLTRSAGGDQLQGVAGDWIMQYAPGDYGIVQAQRFRRVYRPAD